MSTKEQPKITPLLAVVCDDIRQETGNKPFIIGIYTTDINVSLPEDMSGPAMMHLALWMPYTVSKVGEASVEIMFIGPDPDSKINAYANVKFQEKPSSNEIAAITLTGVPIKIDREGELQVLFRNQGEKDWEIIRSIPINIKRVATTI